MSNFPESLKKIAVFLLKSNLYHWIVATLCRLKTDPHPLDFRPQMSNFYLKIALLGFVFFFCIVSGQAKGGLKYFLGEILVW